MRSVATKTQLTVKKKKLRASKVDQSFVNIDFIGSSNDTKSQSAKKCGSKESRWTFDWFIMSM